MINAEITGWGKCLPPAILTNDDLATFMETSDEWIRPRTGIGQRHISHVSTSDLATVAAQRALACAGMDASELDMILLATLSPDTTIPNAASKVQANLGVQCAAMDINAACSGFLYGLGLATSQIKSGFAKKILVIGAERLSFFLNWAYRDSAVLFGDGAGAAIVQAVESDQPGGIMNYALNSDSRAREALICKGFGTDLDKFDPDATAFYLQFDGREVFKRAVGGMVKLSQQVLYECKVDKDEVDLVIPHQANVRIIDAVINKMDVPAEKGFINIEQYGNTSAATIPIALCDALEQGRIKPGDTLLSCGFGAGLSSAATLIKWGDRITPKAESDAELPPCDQTALQIIAKAVKRDVGKDVG